MNSVQKHPGRPSLAATEKSVSRRRITDAMHWLLIVSGLCFSYMLMCETQRICDENWHVSQIGRFLNWDFTIIKGLTVVPVYHFFMFVILAATNGTYTQDARFVSFLVSALCVPAFFSLAKKMWSPKIALDRTVQFTFLPTIFYLFPMVYTDLWALLFVLLMVSAALDEEPSLSCFYGALATAIRQPNIVWVGFVWLLFLQRDRKLSEISFIHFWTWLRGTWSFIVLFVAFGAFVIWNNGIAVGDRKNQAIGLHLENIWFFSLLFFTCSLPFCWGWCKGVYALARRHPVFSLLCGLAILTIIVMTYIPIHPYNQASVWFFLRNRILWWTTQGVNQRVLSAFPIAFGLFGFLKTHFAQLRFAWLVPVSLGSLVVMPLIEQRYYIVPLALYIAFRAQEERGKEMVQTALFVFVSIWMMIGIANNSYFP